MKRNADSRASLNSSITTSATLGVFKWTAAAAAVAVKCSELVRDHRAHWLQCSSHLQPDFSINVRYSANI